ALRRPNEKLRRRIWVTRTRFLHDFAVSRRASALERLAGIEDIETIPFEQILPTTLADLHKDKEIVSRVRLKLDYVEARRRINDMESERRLDKATSVFRRGFDPAKRTTALASIFPEVPAAEFSESDSRRDAALAVIRYKHRAEGWRSPLTLMRLIDTLPKDSTKLRALEHR